MRWRLLLHGPGHAAWNMAVDETLFDSAVEGVAPPTVRFYGWARPTLSIGFRQNLSEACDFAACRRLGIDAVRRLSGGRAVLHDQELTYCVAASAREDFRGLSVLGIYRWVSDVLRRGLEGRGIPLDPLPSSTDKPSARSIPNDTLPCFAVPTGHEIASAGRKLVGGAQKWSRRGFMQHGSILMGIDSALWSQALGPTAAAAVGAVSVNELASRRVETSELMQDFAIEFEKALGEPPSQDKLLPSEMKKASSLAQCKYSSPEWNLFRRAMTV